MSEKKTESLQFNTRMLTFCAISLALSYITSTYLVFTKLPYGGSITFFSMFFICFIGYLYGPVVGITTGFCYGLLQLITNPYIIHPVQLIMDYFLAFGALGIAGFFCKSKNGLLKGYIVSVFMRYVCAVASGYIFFSEYAWEGWSILPYSLVYNATYIFPEAILTIILIPVLSKALSEVKKMALSTS